MGSSKNLDLAKEQLQNITDYSIIVDYSSYVQYMVSK